MGRIDDDDIRRVREATDLVELAGARVVLRQKGRLFWGCCPFHDEKTPSFKIDPDTQLWHCFGCGRGGDVFGFVMEDDGLDFPEAVRELADRAHIEITETGGPGVSRNARERMMSACAAAEEFFSLQLMRSREDGAARARDYLSSRGFGSAVCKSWKLGWAPGHGALVAYLSAQGFTRAEMLDANLATDRSGRLKDRFFERVMFPVHDVKGRTIAFGGRIIADGEPKYLNTSETPVFHKSDSLFGIDRAKSAITSAARAVVVEGYTDVIALHGAGVTNAVATLGTALTASHVKLLGRFANSIVYLFDGDAAGQKAAQRASEFIDWNSAIESRRDPIDLRVVVLPDGKDPAEFVAAEGASGIERVLATSEPLLAFCINRCLDSFDVHVPEQKAAAMQQALEILLPLRGSITADDYVNLIADRLGADKATVDRAFAKMRPPAHARRTDGDRASAGTGGGGSVHMQGGASQGGARDVGASGASGSSASASGVPATVPGASAAAIGTELAADRDAIARERKLVALVVSSPAIVAEMGPRIAQIDFHDAAAGRMADALISLPADTTPASALAAAQSAEENAPALLAAAMGDEADGEQMLYQARLIVHDLRIRDLDQRQRELKARMRTDTSLSAEDLDDLFAQSIAVQDELKSLRAEKLA